MTNSSFVKPFFLFMLCLLPFSVSAYTPKAEKVVDNVYAIIGPLDQRSEKNDGLNNNLGFIVTKKGVILIDSGASLIGAKRVAGAIKAITSKPVKWVVNTGSQDHRWLGNDYFAKQGAQIIAMENTVKTQKKSADNQLKSLTKFLGKRLDGTKPLSAAKPLKGDNVEITLGGEKLVLTYTNAHFPGDVMIWLPEHKVVFTGDLVYLDRLLSVRSSASMYNGQIAYKKMEALKPKYIVPGHGRVSDLKGARAECGDYYDFLVNKIGAAAQDMEDIGETLNKYNNMKQFSHMKHYDSMHRANMNRTFVEFENR